MGSCDSLFLLAFSISSGFAALSDSDLSNIAASSQEISYWKLSLFMRLYTVSHKKPLFVETFWHRRGCPNSGYYFQIRWNPFVSRCHIRSYPILPMTSPVSPNLATNMEKQDHLPVSYCPYRLWGPVEDNCPRPRIAKSSLHISLFSIFWFWAAASVWPLQVAPPCVLSIEILVSHGGVAFCWAALLAWVGPLQQ